MMRPLSLLTSLTRNLISGGLLRGSMLLVLVAGCASAPPVSSSIPLASSSDAQAIISDLRNRVSQDNELTPILVGMSELPPKDRGFFFVVGINGKMWSDLTRSQQERVANKLGSHLQD